MPGACKSGYNFVMNLNIHYLEQLRHTVLEEPMVFRKHATILINVTREAFVSCGRELSGKLYGAIQCCLLLAQQTKTIDIATYLQDCQLFCKDQGVVTRNGRA